MVPALLTLLVLANPDPPKIESRILEDVISCGPKDSVEGSLPDIYCGHLVPLGFSKQGHFAFFIKMPEGESEDIKPWEFRIVDLATDKVVAKKVMGLKSIGLEIKRNLPALSALASKYEIETDPPVRPVDFPVATGAEFVDLQIEMKDEDGRAVEECEINLICIQSHYLKYNHSGKRKFIVKEKFAALYSYGSHWIVFKNPSENRLALIRVHSTQWEGQRYFNGIDVIGSNLDVGFK